MRVSEMLEGFLTPNVEVDDFSRLFSLLDASYIWTFQHIRLERVCQEHVSDSNSNNNSNSNHNNNNIKCPGFHSQTNKDVIFCYIISFMDLENLLNLLEFTH
jgi:hypothetical protein